MTQVKHEYGDWIVYVNGNPKFSFIYREEAEAVAEVIDALVVANDYIIETAPDEIYPHELLDNLETALKKIGIER